MNALPPAPDRDEALAIAARIYGFAERIAEGETRSALNDMHRWFCDGPGEIAVLHTWYLATTAPVLVMGLVRKHFPVDIRPDELWVLKVDPQPIPDAHAWAMAQAVTRQLNDDQPTALDLIDAHYNTHGVEGLFRLGCEAVKLLAGLIRYGREAVAS